LSVLVAMRRVNVFILSNSYWQAVTRASLSIQLGRELACDVVLAALAFDVSMSNLSDGAFRSFNMSP
jgi:hypothetical protein